jgi:hypothetical protein
MSATTLNQTSEEIKYKYLDTLRWPGNEGIGSSHQAGSSGSVSIQAQVQTQIVESLSIYICGLPLDIDEKDLGEISHPDYASASA